MYRGDVEQAVDWLGDTLLNPLFTEEDMDDARQILAYEMEERPADPATIVSEVC